MTPELESAVAILDKHRYRGCRWFVITAGSEYQLRFAAGDFIETNARAKRITFVEFEACAVAAALEPMTPELLRDVEALCDNYEKHSIKTVMIGGGLFDRCERCFQKISSCGEAKIIHDADCPVLLAERIRERMKADGR